jgi:DNA-directed RNA polymerase specialized sigma24 family protein
MAVLACPDEVTTQSPAPASERWAVLSLHRDRVVSVLRGRGFAAEDAEDSVHDALLQLMAHPALDLARAGSLLTVVAMRRCCDRQRSHIREQRAAHRLGRLGTMHPSPVDWALDRVEVESLVGHVHDLPERQRDVVGHRAVGFTTAETARTMGISPKAAESALSRARVTLRAIAWGAAAALLWAVRRARTMSASPASAAAATMTVGLLASVVPASGQRSAAPVDVEQSFIHVSPVSRTAAHALHGPFEDAARVAPDLTSHQGRTSHSAAGTAAPQTGAAPPPLAPRQSIAVSAAGGQHDVGNDGVTVQTTHNNATFAESLQQCVTQGVSTDAQHLGCPPR